MGTPTVASAEAEHPDTTCAPAALRQWHVRARRDATRPSSACSYDFVHDRLVDGRVLRMLCMIDEYPRECLPFEVGASLRPQDVILTLSRLMRLYGKPVFIRSGNGAELMAAKVMRWQRDDTVGSAFIAPDCPWQNGFAESFTGKLRDELLNRDWFCSRAEAKVLVERWRQFYNERRPHSVHHCQPAATIRRAWMDSDNFDTRLTAQLATESRRGRLDGAYPGSKISSWVRRRAAEDYTQGLQPSILTADQCGQRMRDLLGRASQIVN